MPSTDVEPLVRWMADPVWRTALTRHVAAAPAVVWSAFERLRNDEVRLTTALFTIRILPALLSGRLPPEGIGARAVWASMTDVGFVPLDAGRERAAVSTPREN